MLTKRNQAVLEAQIPPILSRTRSTPLPTPEYQHTGRGGAGNYVAPSPFPLTSPTAPPKITLQNQSKPTYRGGRGGAGNYVDFAEEERARKVEEERIRREVEEAISRDVDAGLARPERAYGGIGGSWEMGSMK